MSITTEHQLVKTIIRAHHDVFVVGPGWSIDEDPTTAHACTIARSVHVVDTQIGDENLERALEEHLVKSKVLTAEQMRINQLESGGAGDFTAYVKSMQAFRNKSRLEMFKPRLVYENILHADLGQNIADVIIDRGTSQFTVPAGVAESGAWERREPRPREMLARIKRLAVQYHKMLRTEGKAVMMFRTKLGLEFAKHFEKEFEKLGMRVDTHVLKPEHYRIGPHSFPHARQYAVALVAHKN